MTKKTWVFKLDSRSRESITVQARTKGEARAEVKREMNIRPKNRLPRVHSLHAI
jgi:hypothetical protein